MYAVYYEDCNRKVNGQVISLYETVEKKQARPFSTAMHGTCTLLIILLK